VYAAHGLANVVAEVGEVVLGDVKPGLTMLTRTPAAPASHLREARSPSSAAFAVEWAVSTSRPWTSISSP